MQSLVTPIILVPVGLLPSLIWLFLYLKKDCHPEPRHLLIETFLMGMIISPLAVILQWTLTSVVNMGSANFYLGAALIEELVKLLAVVLIAIRDPEFDEPVDAMIYMIVASLGFAAIENILFLFKSIDQGVVFATQVIVLRFIGATLLHALAGAITGYLLAIAWFYREHAKKIITAGIVLATVFHFSFNLLISNSGASLRYPKGNALFMGYAIVLLLAFLILVQLLFSQIRDRHRRQISNLCVE